jgi:hypothetical protein
VRREVAAQILGADRENAPERYIAAFSLWLMMKDDGTAMGMDMNS